MINVKTNARTLYVIAHALDFYIQNVDINETLEREICAAACPLERDIRKILDDELKKREKRNINLIS